METGGIWGFKDRLLFYHYDCLFIGAGLLKNLPTLWIQTFDNLTEAVPSKAGVTANERAPAPVCMSSWSLKQCMWKKASD